MIVFMFVVSLVNKTRLFRSTLWVGLFRTCSHHLVEILSCKMLDYQQPSCLLHVCVCAPSYSAAGVSASFGEMLLLVAMYFHSNQLSSIIELVCSTLGMKVMRMVGGKH